MLLTLARNTEPRASGVRARGGGAAQSYCERCLRGLALIPMLAILVAPTAANGTVAFSTVPNAPNLATVALNAQSRTINATMANWGVQQTTSQSGWNVTVNGDASAGKSAVFKRYCSNGASACGADAANAYVTGGATLAANSLKLNSTAAGWTGGTGTLPTHSCNAGCNVDSAAAVKVASASTSVGLTTWNTTGYSGTSLA